MTVSEAKSEFKPQGPDRGRGRRLFLVDWKCQVKEGNGQRVPSLDTSSEGKVDRFNVIHYRIFHANLH